MAPFNQSPAEFQSAQTQTFQKVAESTQFIARVTHIVQGPYLVGTKIPDAYYKNPTDLGVITFQLLNSNQSSTLDSGGNSTAKPISSAFKHYPLEGELVYIMACPVIGMN